MMSRGMTIACVVAACVVGLLALGPELTRTSLAQQAAPTSPPPPASGPIKTLLVTGGPIYDGKAISETAARLWPCGG